MRILNYVLISFFFFSCSKSNIYLKHESAFIKAIQADDTEKVKEEFKAEKVTIDSRIGGDHPVVLAKSIEMYEALKSLGFDMSWDKSEYGHFLLGVFNGNNHNAPVELIIEFIKLGHPVNFQESLNGYTPAMLLVKSSNSNKLEKLEVLKENGADFSLKSKKGETVYQMVKDESIIKYLQSIGVNK